MLELRVPTRDTLVALMKLKVAPSQQGLVAEAAQTLAQAAYEPGSQVWGLWVGDQAVGLMAMIDPRRTPHLEPGDDPEAAYLWRLMIDEGVQRRGHGRAALQLAADQARLWGLPRMTAGVVDRADSALDFYTGFGFRPTGRKLDGEIEILLDLA